MIIDYPHRQVNQLHRNLSRIAVVAWAILIFHFSHQPVQVSRELSTSVTEIVVESIRTWQPDHAYTIADLHVFVRKSAHMLLYFVFGGLVLHALSIRTRPDLRRMLLALTVCVSYALTDEWHQLYVPGRGAQLRDVLIDTSGAMLGILTYKLAHLLITRLYLHRQ